MPPSPLEMTHVSQVQISGLAVLNNMDRGGPKGGGGGRASQVSGPHGLIFIATADKLLHVQQHPNDLMQLQLTTLQSVMHKNPPLPLLCKGV